MTCLKKPDTGHDDDTSTDGHQASLTMGTNAITVTVTSAGGVNIQTYTVAITRAAS